MSYRCQECNAVRYGSELKVIKEIKDVDYKYMIQKKSYSAESEPSFILVNESKGWEIRSEIKVCDACYQVMKDNVPLKGEKKTVRTIVEKKQDSDRGETKSSVSHSNAGKFKSFNDAFESRRNWRNNKKKYEDNIEEME